ncbi:hypothetical protein BD410DRAFT_751462 [Rickenella mellea]|uniref:DUF323-domain-containing protein n=1 Tax=Rickenella mellea TaxID=50990 RepID=A0A4Y7PYT1_9AGAM|nr:hypothetical protein BD410DRAFT_751462 [Rickenella mellea]
MFAANKWTRMNRDEGKSMPGYFVTRENVNDEVIPSELPMKGSASDLILRFTTADALNLFSSSNLRSLFALPLPSISSTIYLLERPPFTFPPLFRDNNTNVHANTNTTTTTNPFGPPTVAEWQRIWNAWDFVTLRMIPPEMLHQKPIDLRHKCLFYIGHLPTFLDILLSKLLNEPYSEPKCFTTIFERGIDPHVDDPNHCHNHSDVPEADEDWPTLESILAYRDRVRARLMRLYDDIDTGKRRINRRIARVLQMTNEHEGFHVETLLYMLIQNAGCGTVPPPGFTTPPWELLAAQWNALPEPSTPKVILGPTKLVMGHDDSELADLEEPEAGVYEHVYGWDNESPRRVVEVGKFMIEWRPVTNGEFYEFWKAEGNEVVRMPRSWRLVDNEVFVLTLHGLVPLDIAQHWPVLTSFDDLTTYAKSKGGRIPTEPELRLFLDTYEVGHEGGANVAFRNWHPIPATTGIAENGGRGSNGGVWEWTSTVFDGHEGMAPTSLFPGYSSDFFDGKHQVVIGASYATIPSLAGRRTLRNFYQHNYPYPWVGARVAYDCV